VLVPVFFGDHDITLSVILGVDNYPALPVFARINGNLDFGVRIYSNVEDLPMAGEPGIRPTAVIADSDWSDAVDNK
jgi:hypothetical protein